MSADDAGHDCSELRDFRVSFPGPFTQNLVAVDGWSVPFLSASFRGEDGVRVILDDRIGIDLSVGEAERLLPFIADAVAVALGYGAHPRQGGPDLPPRMPHMAPRRVVESQLLPG
ncbi:MAG: hypothetical protein ABSC56_06580 [Solirubrobacteraceae bacterium]|jgi:hypothetical protein